MNKKASVMHWIVPGMILVIGIAVMFFIGRDPGTGVRGLWPTTMIWVAQENEAQQLEMDTLLWQIVQQTKEQLNQAAASDLGSGTYQYYAGSNPPYRLGEVPILNSGPTFYELNIKDNFLTSFNINFQANRIFPQVYYNVIYNSIVIDSSDLIGQARDPIDWVADTYQISTNLPSLEPYYYEYSYNPSFRLNLQTDFEVFRTAPYFARTLYQACHGQTDLDDCLHQYFAANPLPNGWSEPNQDCQGDVITVPAVGHVVFCVQEGGFEFPFALNFN